MSDEHFQGKPPEQDGIGPEPDAPIAPSGLRSAAWTDVHEDAASEPAASEPATSQSSPGGTTGEEHGAAEPPGTSPEDTTAEQPDAALDFRQRATLLADHNTWLERPSTVRALKWGSLGLLAATVVVEAWLLPNPEAHFEGIDGWVGFHAVYGFVTCVAMVLGAKFVLGSILKRKDSYYDG